MKRIFSAIAILVLFPVFAAAAEKPDADMAKKQAQVKKLMDLTGGAKMVSQMKEQFKMISEQSAVRALEGKEMDEESKAVMKKYTNKMIDSILSEKNMNKMLDAAVPIYAKHLTSKEIQDIIDFYESPSGKKMIEALPKIMKEYMPAVMEIQKPWQEEMKKEMDEMTKELKAIAEKKKEKEPKEEAPSETAPVE